MPIKLKKSDIQHGIESPEKGYMVLGFDKNGELVFKDDNGDYGTIIPTVPTAKFTNLKTDYFTIGYRTSDYEGMYSYAQGENTTSSGYTSFSQGKGVTAEGDYSHARGENTHAITDYSFASGRGANNAYKLTAGGINSFVHSWANNIPSGTYGDYSVILGGSNHNITSGGNNSVILGGNSNTIDTLVDNSAIISCVGVTVDKDNVVYVPRLSLMDSSFFSTPPDGTIYFNGTDMMARIGTNDVSLTASVSGLVTSVGTTTPILTNTGSATAPIITHATLAGYKHIPSGGSIGQYLTNTASGTGTWSTLPNIPQGTVTEVNTTGAILGGPFTTSGTISHSNTNGNLHIPINGSTDQYLKYSGTAGTAEWATIPGGLSVTENYDNFLLTAQGTNVIKGEHKLTFDDVTLDIDANLTIHNKLTSNGHVDLGSNSADYIHTYGKPYFDIFDGPVTIGNKYNNDRLLSVGSTGEVKNHFVISGCVTTENGTTDNESITFINQNNISSVIHINTGDYKIYFDTPYAQIPTVVFNVATTDSYVFKTNVSTITTTYVTVELFRGADTETSRTFSLIAFGYM